MTAPREFAYVDTSVTTSLKRESVFRDLRRRAQNLRDKLDVEMDERVVLTVDAEHTLVQEAVETYREELTEEMRAEALVTDADEAEVTTTLSWTRLPSPSASVG